MVKQIYKTAIIGTSATISDKSCALSVVDPIELNINELTKGWNVMVHDEQHCKVFE